MADKNIQMTQRNANNDGWDNLYPKTKASSVNFLDNTDLETYKTVIPTTTTVDITYYVATTGSDSNNGTSSSTPFKTIAKAISKIPQIVNHAITINIAAGTYSEPIILKGYIGNGSITINSSTPTVIGSVSVTYARFDYCTVSVTMSGVNATTYGDSTGSFIVLYCKYVIFRYCSTTFSGPTTGFTIVGCDVAVIQNTTISNKTYSAISASASIVSVASTTGSGNAIGLYATVASVIIKVSGVSHTATTATYTEYGATIV